MSRQLYIHTLQGMRDVFQTEHMDTQVEALDAAIEKFEQPEIIRCKDCAKRKYCITATVWAVAPGDDWYCADAERRTDG